MTQSNSSTTTQSKTNGDWGRKPPYKDMNTFKTISYKDYVIALVYDTEPDSPREWDNLGRMAFYHGRYNLGDRKQIDDAFALQEYLEENKDTILYIPVYMYDHGGITIKTSPFGCEWDSGLLGYIYVSREKAREEGFTDDSMIYDRLEDEVAIYDQYLRGDVYGYKIFDGEGNELDSCYGFYGDQTCEDAGKEMVDYYDRTTPKQLELELA